MNTKQTSIKPSAPPGGWDVLSLFWSRACTLLLLTVIIYIPLIMNGFSKRVFDPDKAVMLQGFALALLLANLMAGLPKLIRRSPDGGLTFHFSAPASLKHPVTFPILGLFIAVGISLYASVYPQESWFGSYERLQGGWTWLAYLVIFVISLTVIKTPNVRDQLITVITATSLPVCLYAVAQSWGTDPLVWGRDTSVRVTSTLGNPIFLGAYLVLVFPFTIYRVVQCRKQGQHGMSISLCLLAVLQLTALYESGSRGPVVALLTGLWFALLLFARQNYRRAWTFIIALGPLLTLTAWLQVQNHLPLQEWGSQTGLGRFTQLTNPESKNARVRIVIWEGAAELFLHGKAQVFSAAGKDHLHPFRRWIGYGPETLKLVFTQTYPPELGQIENRSRIPDRAHNETWGVLLNLGILGCFFFYLLVFTLTALALEKAGMLAGHLRRIYIPGSMLSSLLCTALVAALFSPAWIAVGPLAGWLLFTLIILCLRPSPSEASPDSALLYGTLFCLIIIHMVEIHVGIAVTTTRLLFAVAAGLICVDLSGSASAEHHHRNAPPWITVLILTPLLYAWIRNPNLQTKSLTILGDMWSGIAAALLTATLIGCSLLLSSAPHQKPTRIWIHILGNTLSCGVIALCLAYSLGRISSIQSSTMESFLENADILSQRFSLLFWGTLLIIFLVSFRPALSRSRTKVTHLLPLLASLALFLILFAPITSRFILPIVEADTLYKNAEQFSETGNHTAGLALFRRTLHHYPREDDYCFGLSRSLHLAATQEKNPVVQAQLMDEAIRVLDQAQRENPLKYDHPANLGRLYFQWAQLSRDPVQRQAHTAMADRKFARACELNPNQVKLWCERANLYFHMSGHRRSVESILKRAYDLDPLYYEVHKLHGDHFSRVGLGAKTSQDRQLNFQRAVAAYEHAFILHGPKNFTGRSRAHLQTARCLHALNEHSRSDAHYRKALRYANQNQRSAIEKEMESISSTSS